MTRERDVTHGISAFVSYLMPKLSLYKNECNRPKVNVIAQEEFKVVYNDAVVVQNVSHYVMETSLLKYLVGQDEK